MAVTKILARRYRVNVGVEYALNGDKTQEKILTATHRCTPGNEYSRMMKTKERFGQKDGVQCYHIIQSFAPGEITPELALEIAKEFTSEYLSEYETVIGVHVDKRHVHSHIVFNSVSRDTGKKYISTPKKYYQQIRGISDRLCREHGLSVIMHGETSKTVSYCEWLREQRGQPTFRSMLEADLNRAIEDANDYGHFLMLMENMGYEVKHGSRLSFRLRGQESWMVPGRKNPRFTEDGIRAAIAGELRAIEAGLRPVFAPRRVYVPFKKHPKYTGFLALYVHYLYVLGKVKKQEYPPKLTPRFKSEVMKFEKYKAQFAFLREHGISAPGQLAAFREEAQARLAALTKQRTILNVNKKKKKKLYDALATEQALKPAEQLYAEGMSGIEGEFAEYMDAVRVLDESGVPRETLAKEKAEIYEAVADVNRQIRSVKKEIATCEEISNSTPHMEKDVQSIEKPRTKEKTQERKWR